MLAAMLSSRLKSHGILTMQLKGDGLVKFVVVDAVYGGALRGYAEIAPGAAETIEALSLQGELTLQDLLGKKGYLAITLDKGSGSPYQGIVALSGDSLSEAVQAYFTQSEQTEVMVRVSVGRERVAGEKAGKWCAGGIMLQQIPHEGGTRIEGSNQIHYEGMHPKEQWQRSKMFAETVQDHELLDSLLTAPELLYRLF